MKWVKTMILAMGVLFCFSAVPAQAQVWGACDGDKAPVTGSTAICGDETAATDLVKRIIDVFLYAIGALSVIMIIHSGLKYINSRGDPEAVKSAKNTLMYAVVGLIVAILAFTIVNFVIKEFGGSGNADQVQDGVNAIGGEGATALPNVIKTVVDMLLFFIGALSIVMIIYGGFKYITSGGEASAVTSAKNTLMYAVIGLVVAILAYAIVGFVVNNFG